jgi:Mrp family chromosome partitioning ATPase
VLDICQKRVALITGKGGVGRTTLSAAIARVAAAQGIRTLVTEIGEPDGDYTPLARLFGRDTFPGDPVDLAPNLKGCTLWSRKGHAGFFKRVIPVGAVARAASNSSALRKLLESAPSFREMGVFYHMFSLLEERLPNGEYTNQLVIIDMPASGHTLGLTGLRGRLKAIMPTGPIANALDAGEGYFHDPDKVGAYIVTLPETLPVTESLELAEGLVASNTPIGGMFVNRVLADPFTPDERAALAPYAHQMLYGMARYRQVPAAERALALLRNSTDLTIHEVPEVAAIGDALLLGIQSTLTPVEAQCA